MSGSPLLQSAELLRLGAASATKVLAFDALRGKQVAIYFSGTYSVYLYGSTRTGSDRTTPSNRIGPTPTK